SSYFPFAALTRPEWSQLRRVSAANRKARSCTRDAVSVLSELPLRQTKIPRRRRDRSSPTDGTDNGLRLRAVSVANCLRARRARRKTPVIYEFILAQNPLPGEGELE